MMVQYKYKLKIYLNSLNGILKDALCDMAFPERIDGEVCVCESVPTEPTEGVSIIITDRLEMLKKAVLKLYDERFIVYCGSYLNAAPYLAVLDDLWSSIDASSVMEIRLRCQILLKRIISLLDSKLYKNICSAAFDAIPDMLWCIDGDGVITSVNKEFASAVDAAEGELVGKAYDSVWGDKHFSETHTNKAYLTGSDPADGRELVLYRTSFSMPAQKAPGELVVANNPVSFDKLCLEFSEVIEAMPYAMAIFAPDWSCIKMNNRFKSLSGIGGKSHFNYKKWVNRVFTPCGEPKDKGTHDSVSREYKLDRGMNCSYYIINETKIHDRLGCLKGYFCTITDNTFYHTYMAAVNTDMLTGMYNRRYFFDHLKENIHKPLYLLYLDLDNFKAVNDTYGHDVGDEVLVRVAQLINKFFPNSLAARLGGDGFVVVNDTSSKEELEESIKELEATVVKEFRMYECDLGISIGMVYSGDGSFNTDVLLRESDVMMYEIKKKHHGTK